MTTAPLWYLITPLILFIILIPGGFFMFRAFLRRMAPEQENRENQG
ncbi:MAG: hypothetical protein WCC10_16410 [Tumebacillaceae bacterium]